MSKSYELARAAGFFNGEGSTYLQKYWRKSNPEPWLEARISVAQSGETIPDDLVQFENAVNRLGLLYGPFLWKSSKPRYQYRICGLKRVERIIALLWPWLSEIKRHQAQVVIDACKGQSKLSTGRKHADCIGGHGWKRIWYDKKGNRHCLDCAKERKRKNVRVIEVG